MKSNEPVRLGLRENLGQFSLLVVVNAFVGATVGLERAVLPLIAEQEFMLASRTAILSFIVGFGIVKAVFNLLAGTLSDRLGRKHLLILGWVTGLPVPFLIMYAPTWKWIVFANLLLGVNQGLCWSTTVVMKIDLVGPLRRGLAMGWNEFAGYLSVALAALASGYIAAEYGLRPHPFYLGIAFVLCGFLLSVFFVRETHGHALQEARTFGAGDGKAAISFKDVFLRTSWTDRTLFCCTQAGMVNNLNDGMVWGLLPLFLSSRELAPDRIGVLAAVYPATWGLMQLYTGAFSDRVGRKWMIASGMLVQAAGILLIPWTDEYWIWFSGLVLLGIGTAQVYSTLIAAVSDVADPRWRAGSVGVYRSGGIWVTLSELFSPESLPTGSVWRMPYSPSVS